jgi:phosphatidylglycerol:prolipoprotein diacylglycerol transferase
VLPDDFLRLGPIQLHWFGIFLALALLAAGWASSREFARKRLDPQVAWDGVIWGALGGLAGARLWVIVETWPAFLDAPLRFLTGSGLAWYGGFVGGAVAITVLWRLRAIPWLVGADALAPALALGHAIGRIGCQVAGDGDWGTETTLPWGMAYPHAVVGWDKPPGVVVHPTPIYEMLAYLAVFAWLWRARREPWPNGRAFGTYLLWAGLARFAIEFVRINPRVILGMSVAQVASLVMAGVGVALLAHSRRPTSSIEEA